MRKCAWIDLSAFYAAIDALPASATLIDCNAEYRRHPGVKCTANATHRVEVYSEFDQDDDSQVHVCAEHVKEWSEDDFTAIYTLNEYEELLNG